jgi:glycosyltransferase involved in cell wall biosynthesis
VSDLPFVSCVICAYNYERFVAEAVQSALDQDYPRDRFEVIVVDDGSTDGTPEVLRGFGDEIRVVRQENAGLNAATERGIRESRGELIALLDADDAWTPDKLRRQVELFRRPEVGLTFTDKEMVDDDGRRLHPSFLTYCKADPEAGRPLDRLVRQNFVPAPTIMFRSSLRDHVLPMPPEAACQDWWLAVKVTEIAEIDWIDAPLTRYRIHGDNMGVGAAGDKENKLVRRDNKFRRWMLRTLPLEGVRPGMLHWALSHIALSTEMLCLRTGTTHMEELPVTDADRAEAARHAAAAEAAEAAGDLDTAMRWWTAARAADPFDQRLSDRFDDAYARHQDEGTGFDTPLPGDPAGRIAWAEAAHEAGDSGNAMDVLLDVAETCDDRALAVRARADLCVVLFSFNNIDLARRQAAEVVAEDRTNATALEVLARCSIAEGDHVQAEHWLTRGTEAEPRSAELWQLLAASRAERARWADAAAAWHAAAELAPLTPGQELAREDAERHAARAFAADALPATGEPGRALVVVDFFYPSVGGSERLAEGVGVALRDLGWSVEVACRALPERTSTRHRGMRIHEIRDNARQELRELVARRGYDAVIAFSDPQAWPVVATMRLPAGPRVVVVPCVMPHNEKFLRLNLDNLRTWRRLLGQVHAPVHSSFGGRDARLHADLGIDAEYVPNASEEIPAEGSLRELFGIAPDMPLLLHVSNYAEQKNHIGLLEALAEHPGDFRLVMVGHALPSLPRIERQIRSLAAADPRVILAGGLPGELVSAGMRQADLLVHPSVSEGAPITVLEAMSHGLPWIATPGCGAVHDHAGGLILPVRQFGAAIDFLLARPDTRAALGAAGRDHWENAYTYDVIAQRYDALLRGARRLPALEMPASALAVTDAVRANFYDSTLLDPAAVAGADALLLYDAASEA